MQLTLDEVVYSYDGRRNVVDGVSLSFEPGASVALMGPSGSGKSTLLALAGRVVRPTSGRVLHQYDEAENRGIGWILQTTNALPRRTVLDNVVLGGHSSRLSRPSGQRRASQLLELVGLGGYERRLAGTLSGGELQRVVVARAILGRPPLLLADEPTGQLDRASTVSVLDALFAARPLPTILMVATHDPEVAARCEVTVKVVDGAIQRSD